MLEAYSWSLDRTGGSHHLFKKRGERSISVPVHDKKVGRRYLDEIGERLGRDQSPETSLKTRVVSIMRLPVSDYLALRYPFTVEADPDVGYFISFPDLPGCMTQVEELDEIGPAAEEIRQLWIEAEYDQGADIPLPSAPGDYSGKFLLRVSRSLHRSLAMSAEREGISLNQYAATLLARGDAIAHVERRLDDLARQSERTDSLVARNEALPPRSFRAEWRRSRNGVEASVRRVPDS